MRGHPDIDVNEEGVTYMLQVVGHGFGGGLGGGVMVVGT